MTDKQFKTKIMSEVCTHFKKDPKYLKFFLVVYDKNPDENREIFFVSNGPKKSDAGLVLIQALEILEESI